MLQNKLLNPTRSLKPGCHCPSAGLAFLPPELLQHFLSLSATQSFSLLPYRHHCHPAHFLLTDLCWPLNACNIKHSIYKVVHKIQCSLAPDSCSLISPFPLGLLLSSHTEILILFKTSHALSWLHVSHRYSFCQEYCKLHCLLFYLQNDFYFSWINSDINNTLAAYLSIKSFLTFLPSLSCFPQSLLEFTQVYSTCLLTGLSLPITLR